MLMRLRSMTFELVPNFGMFKLKDVFFTFVGWRTGNSFRKAVLISVMILGLYLVYSGAISSNDKWAYQRSPFRTLNYGNSQVPLPAKARILYNLDDDKSNSIKIQNLTSASSPFPPKSSPSKLHAESCKSHPTDGKDNHSSACNKLPTSSSVDSRILLLYDKVALATAKSIRSLLVSHRIPHHIHLHKPNYRIELEEDVGGGTRGRYCGIICADMVFLYHHWERSHLLYYLDYAKRYSITFINFSNSSRLISDNFTGEIIGTHFGNFSVTHMRSEDIKGVLLNSSKDFYYLKTDEMVTSITPSTQWTTIDAAHSKLEVLAEIEHKVTSHDTKHVTSPVVVVSDGRQVDGEGFMHVLIGAPISFWLTKLMLLEVIRSYVSSPRPLARFGRKRWLMVDIDDIFVAPNGLKLTPGDVQVRCVKLHDIFRSLYWLIHMSILNVTVLTFEFHH